jgi:hypothetical protein
VSDTPTKPKPARDRKKANLVKRSTALAAIWEETPQAAGSLAFMARALTQATLPHSETDALSYTRQNGRLKLVISTTPEAGGLPYGVLPRLLLAWITTEAVKSKSREVYLGRNIAEFMEDKLGMQMTGGKNGSLTRLRKQLDRLVNAQFKVVMQGEEHSGVSKMWDPIEEAELWWTPRRPAQGTLWQSRLLLGAKFFDEITRNPVPIDWRVLKHVQKSPLKIDIAIWLPWRLYNLERDQFIPWSALELQFGAGYKEPRDFRKAFKAALKDVLHAYRDARVVVSDEGLRLKPSPKLIGSAE